MGASTQRSRGLRLTNDTVHVEIGELARETDMTIRALHHYDQLGLVPPSSRTETGYRMYTTDDLIRLQQVLSLRALGFSLAQNRDLLSARGLDAGEIGHMHRQRLQGEIAARQRILGLLQTLETRLQGKQTITREQLLSTIKEISHMRHIETHYTPEQLTQLQARADDMGPVAIREVEAE